MSPRFDQPVAPGGYAWWYLDALSDDAKHGLTLIAFIGSVFSPYYAQARQRGHGLADPLDHCALNVALYALNGNVAPSGWAMTERRADTVRRSASDLHIGPSSLTWRSDTLIIQIDEVTAPWPSRLRGVVRLRTPALRSAGYPLDAAGHHQWCPLAPHAQVNVELTQPDLQWNGTGYLDTNCGERPLEHDFAHWTWSRAALPDQRSAILYDVTGRDGNQTSLALAFDAQGRVRDFAAPPMTDLPATRWRIARRTRSEVPEATSVLQTLEDGPFYARSLLQTHLMGLPVNAVHESLSMARWHSPVVQLMLPFRMPRRA